MNGKISTPSEVFNAFMIAREDDDIQTLKSILTESALANAEAVCSIERKSFNAALNTFGNRFFGLYDSEKLPVILSERIMGGFAYIEVKRFVSGEPSNFTFLKENGVWKLALDMEVVNEEQSLPEILGLLFNYLKNAFGKLVKPKSK
jgi:hypothetical protein